MAEPITLAEAKDQLNMENDNSKDTLITSLIPRARARVEHASHLSFVESEETEVFYRWGDYLQLWRQPIASVDEITYSTSADSADDIEYTGFLANLGAFPVRISPAIDGSGFPTLGEGQSITVTYTTGVLDEDSREYLLGKQAMLLLLSQWFDNRGEVPLSKDAQMAFDSLIQEISPLSAY